MDDFGERDLQGSLHDVSNALTVVLGWLDRAREARDPAALEQALSRIADEARHAKTLARRAIGAEPQADEPVAAREPVEAAAEAVIPEAGRCGLTLERRFDPLAARAVVRDATALHQILLNLLLNALAMAPRATRIGIELALSGRELSVIVADEGPGVPESQRAGLFTTGRTTRPGGAGIGLRHAAALAARAGGHITLEKSARGARFALTWPCQPGETATASRRFAGLAGLLPGTRVLIVEDEEGVLDLLETALVARGADVVGVRRRSELAPALATGGFDAALLDLSPIADDVRGALDAVQRSSPGVRLIVISGSAIAPDPAFEAVDALWVRKPFEVADILRALAARRDPGRP